jgi:hypothetical protein
MKKYPMTMSELLETTLGARTLRRLHRKTPHLSHHRRGDHGGLLPSSVRPGDFPVSFFCPNRHLLVKFHFNILEGIGRGEIWENG